MSWVRHAAGSEQLPHILASHSLNADALDAHLALYRTIMFGSSALTRSEREAMAVTVSRANDCHY
jgi:alkylhydroperoxidase family enzyme